MTITGVDSCLANCHFQLLLSCVSSSLFVKMADLPGSQVGLDALTWPQLDGFNLHPFVQVYCESMIWEFPRHMSNGIYGAYLTGSAEVVLVLDGLPFLLNFHSWTQVNVDPCQREGIVIRRFQIVYRVLNEHD